MRSSRTVAVALITFATFTDILAYSIAVPVLPDISRRFGASPTLVGVLFASFGLTVLLTSIPMGALSDRIGRRLPLVGGLIALAASSVLFAFAPRMLWLFAARVMQGAADAVTWVVGFAVIADMYSAEERGRIMGLVMSGSVAGFLVGPTIGGWLYQTGGARLPYLVVALFALVAAAGLAIVRLPRKGDGERSSSSPEPTGDPVVDERPVSIPLGAMVRVPAVAVCATAVVIGGGTIAMLEPVLALFFATSIDLPPARIGLVFGAGALVAAVLHPVFGRLADRAGGRRLTLAGLAAIGAVLPSLALISSFTSAVIIYSVAVVAMSMMVAPSLAYMADAMSASGNRSFGVAYGVYNFAWALGLLVGPSIGAAVYERFGLTTLVWWWAPAVIVSAFLLVRVETSQGVATAASANGDD